MRLLRTAAVAATLVVVAAALAADDPWLVPAPSGVEVMMALTNSKRTDAYTLMLADKPWEGASGPERAEPAIPAAEKEALAACRALVAKGDMEGAAKSIDDLVARNAANWDAHALRAQVLHAAKNDAEALAALRTSLIGNRRNPDGWKLLDDVAKALSKKVVRPKLAMRGWVRDLPKGEFEFGHVADDADGMPWNYYAAARVYYRHEGPFARDFPSAKAYAFSFREQMFAMGVLAESAAGAKKDGTKLSAELKRVLAEKAAGTLVPFTFFAVYTEPVPAAPEPGFDTLLPRLVKFFDEKIVVRK